MLERLSEKHRYVMILEENIETGGYGEQVLAYVAGRGLPMKYVLSVFRISLWNTAISEVFAV